MFDADPDELHKITEGHAVSRTDIELEEVGDSFSNCTTWCDYKQYILESLEHESSHSLVF